MNGLLNRTRSTLALGVVVTSFAAGALASAPTATACPIDVDQTTCVGTKTQAPLHFWTSIAKQKHAQHHAARIRRSS